LRRPAWAARRDQRRLAHLFDFAQAVILQHGGYAEAYLAAYPRLEARKIHLIPNGFEPADLNRQPLPPRGERLELVFAGTLQGRQYDTLLLALQRLQRQRPLRLKVTFVGEGWQAAAALAAQLGLAEQVACLAPQPYDWTANRLAQAHALLLLGEYPNPGYELFVASKTYQYLALRRPILAVVPPNAASRLLRRLGAGRVADVASLEAVEAALLEMHAAWERDDLGRYLPAESALAEFSEPRLTAALVRALENAPPCRPYRRGEAALPPSLAADPRIARGKTAP
jgi:glycosyltransferase involved in cell wall biosynthesis